MPDARRLSNSSGSFLRALSSKSTQIQFTRRWEIGYGSQPGPRPGRAWYTRNTIKVKPGFKSLKAWEKKSGTRCKLVVTVGAYGTIAHFARNAKKQGEQWIISAVSFTGADNLRGDLEKYKATDRIIMTQVVPLLNSSLDIVKEAKSKLGDRFGYVELEGYIVGKMFVAMLNDIKGEITRANFMKSANASRLNLGGKQLDFTKSNQGSDEVILSHLNGSNYVATTKGVWDKLIQ